MKWARVSITVIKAVDSSNLKKQDWYRPDSRNLKDIHPNIVKCTNPSLTVITFVEHVTHHIPTDGKHPKSKTMF